MKTALIFLVIAIGILVLLWLSVDVWLGDSTLDIHYHDNYFVVHPWYFGLIVSMLFAGTFFSVGGVIGTKFLNRVFIALVLIFLIADIFVTWKAYRLFHHL